MCDNMVRKAKIIIKKIVSLGLRRAAQEKKRKKNPSNMQVIYINTRIHEKKKCYKTKLI